eukprot:CAMPEP_0198295886 /NCGR_PEP_ID=MMETSP1449-20131203/30176_1 /TAXON_ID=420275 /ORGANISM="Attheya septentrionalis, Strain CCMP2084" /LENGTH=328 /DNA_ID=CAMNT_0043996321 /DNA_START=877 /DNA_END=1863 /DNA_ORIENTATION=+
MKRRRNASWLDAVVAIQNSGSNFTNTSASSDLVSNLRVVYPTTWSDECIVKAAEKGIGSIMHSTWKPGSGRFYGIEDRPVSSRDNSSRTVSGNWPDLIDELIYIPILKNGHTHLMNTVGDLRQRLNGTSELRKGSQVVPGIMEHIYRRQQQEREPEVSPGPGLAVFSIVRESISRFLSSTCQEITFGLEKKMQSKCFQQGGGGQQGAREVTEHNLVDCAILLLQRGQWQAHQVPQVSQIRKALAGRNVGMTLIPQEEAFGPLVDELGGRNIKVRDRTSEHVYQKTDSLRRFCTVKPLDLTKKQTDAICMIYEGDVRMMEYAGIATPFC